MNEALLTFVRHKGGVFSPSYWIARYGFSVGGFSHVAPTLPDGSYIDARADVTHDENGAPITPGVRRRPAFYEDWLYWKVVSIRVSDFATWAAGLKCLKGAIGHQYNQAAIYGMVYGKNLFTRGEYICSQLGYDYGRQSGLGFPSPVPAYEVSPDALFFMATAGWGGQVIAQGQGRDEGLDWLDKYRETNAKAQWSVQSIMGATEMRRSKVLIFKEVFRRRVQSLIRTE